MINELHERSTDWANNNGAYDYMFAAIACVVVVAFLADRLLLVLTGKSLRWHESWR